MRVSAALLAVERRPTEDLSDKVSDVPGVLATHLGKERRDEGILADLPIEGVHQLLDR